MKRLGGVLMPITSLPSPYGIGTIGKTARDFIDFLCKGGQSYWQILPICPTGYGDSPYQSFSSYAGNPYMIDFDDLCIEGLLQESDYNSYSWFDDAKRVDYNKQYELRFIVLKKATENFSENFNQLYAKFCEKNSHWLDSYALFMAIKGHFNGISWLEWPQELRKREKQALASISKDLEEEINFWKKVQFLFFHQWENLKSYAHEHGISIIGDIPIYVSLDSADVWSCKEQFQLDENCLPIEIAGCPPDGFSADGQLWGNPLFDWDYMESTGYDWWIKRIAYQRTIYDVLRIDHFRGFDEYFAIPYGDSTARNGYWKPGPGMKLFNAIKAALGEIPIIAEDLGFLTNTVVKLLKDTGFPGMKVLEFAFDTRDTGFGYLPHSYPNNCVVYTGTHDNETLVGWLNAAPKEEVEQARRYLRLTTEEGYATGIIRSAWASVADTAIIPMPDLLGLGSEGRINTPSTLGNNWTWRCLPGDYNDELSSFLYEEMKLYDRLPK